MLLQNVNATSFKGSLGEKTLKIAFDDLGQEGLKAAKKFRAGKNKYDKIDIDYQTTPVRTMYRGSVGHIDTYMKVSNIKSKKPPVQILLAEKKLPFGIEMLNLITKKMALVDKLHAN